MPKVYFVSGPLADAYSMAKPANTAIPRRGRSYPVCCMSHYDLPQRAFLTTLLLLLCCFAPAVWASNVSEIHDMEDRLAACTSCHGDFGSGSADDPRIPHLAGKPEGYLYQQLQSFRSGRRQHAPMEYVVKHLSSDYLHKIAHYFSQQDVPAHRHESPGVSDAVLERGRVLAYEGDPSRAVPSCQSCHGETLTGVKPMIPGVMGLTYDYIYTQLELWRNHERSSAGGNCMGVVANRMHKDDVKAVSAWLAVADLPDDMGPADSLPAGEELPGWCILADVEGEK